MKVHKLGMVRKACEGTSSGALGYRLCRFEYTEIPCLVSSIIWGVCCEKGIGTVAWLPYNVYGLKP